MCISGTRSAAIALVEPSGFFYTGTMIPSPTNTDTVGTLLLQLYSPDILPHGVTGIPPSISPNTPLYVPCDQSISHKLSQSAYALSVSRSASGKLVIRNMASTPAGRLGIAQLPRRKKRRFDDFQQTLLSDPNLISLTPTAQTQPRRAVAPLPGQPPSSKSSKTPQAPETGPPSFIISTTVKQNTSVVKHVATPPSADTTGMGDGVPINQDQDKHQPDIFHVPGSEHFQGDPILVEDSPTCVQVRTWPFVRSYETNLSADWNTIQPEEEEEETGAPGTGFNRRSKNGARYRREKLRLRSQEFLLHLYRQQCAPENINAGCATCDSVSGSFQCTDCLSSPMQCSSCIVQYHIRLPFHRVQKWEMDGNYGAWQQVTLSKLGLILRLGHGTFGCPNASIERVRPLNVFDLNGQHEIMASFCECQGSDSDQAAMLLDLQLYPATDDLPRVAFTFRLLKHFQLSQCEMSCAAASYYDTLALFTDAVNTRMLPVRSFSSCHERFIHHLTSHY